MAQLQVMSHYSPSNAGINGLGDACGANPCTSSDWLWVSDSCAAYLACEGATSVGQVVGGVATAIGTGIGAGVGGAASGLTSSTSLSGYLALAAGLAALFFFMEKA